MGDRKGAMLGRCDCCCVLAVDRPCSAPRCRMALAVWKDAWWRQTMKVCHHTDADPEHQPRASCHGQKAAGRGSTKNSGGSRRSDTTVSGSGGSRHAEVHGTGFCESHVVQSATLRGGAVTPRTVDDPGRPSIATQETSAIQKNMHRAQTHRASKSIVP